MYLCGYSGDFTGQMSNGSPSPFNHSCGCDQLRLQRPGRSQGPAPSPKLPIFFIPGPRAAQCCLEVVAVSGGGSALCRCASGAPGSHSETGKRCPKKIPFQVTLPGFNANSMHRLVSRKEVVSTSSIALALTWLWLVLKGGGSSQAFGEPTVLF